MSVVASAVSGAAAHTNYCMKMGTIPMLKARKVAAAAILAVAGLTLPCRSAGSTSSFESFPEAPHAKHLDALGHNKQNEFCAECCCQTQGGLTKSLSAFWCSTPTQL